MILKKIYIKQIILKIVHSKWLVLLLLVCCLYSSLLKFGDDGLFHIYFLNVGQGDSIYIRTPGNRDILVDGGKDMSILEELSEVMPFWDRTIDIVIGTHQDNDHIGGLLFVLERYNVHTLIFNGKEKKEALFLRIIELAMQKRVDVEDLNTEDSIQIGELLINVLWPQNLFIGQNDNQSSIVLYGQYHKFSFLLTGDIESEEEMLISDLFPQLQPTILKVSHHGSKTASSRGFLESIHPLIAVISCGENNKFNHPAEEVLTRLQDQKIYIVRTDVHGRIGISVKKDEKAYISLEHKGNFQI